jgi:glycosyltransferase involved in cell wall biosynthesis
MQLIILTPGFPENEQDTTCVPYIQEWVLELQSRNLYTLKIIAFQYPFEERVYFWHGIEVYAAGGKNTQFPWRFRIWYKIWQKILAFKQKEEISHFQSFWLSETAFLAQRFASWHKIPLIMCMLGQDAKPENKYLKFLNLPKSNIIAFSEFVGKILYSHTKKTSKAIPVGLNIKKLDLKTSKEKTMDILGVGGLIPLKQYDIFIEIVAEIAISFPNIRTSIIGEGEQKEKLIHLINEKKLNHNISLLGKIPRNEVFDAMGKSKIFLHTSNYEGQGLVLLEALASGCYVVCFPVGAYPTHHKVWVCNSPSEMAKAILAISAIENPDYEAVIPFHIQGTIDEYLEYCQENIKS